MCRFIESIKIIDNHFQHLEFHQKRLEQTQLHFFENCKKIILSDEIKFSKLNRNKIYKCRVVYAEKIIQTSIIEYKRKLITNIKMAHDNLIEYSFKFEDKEQINHLLKKSGADEILIIKNNFITDTSYSNIVFSDGEKLFTPVAPLLKGTKRKYLIQQNIIEEIEIRTDDLKLFKYFYLVNSMLELDDSNKYPISIIS